LVHLKKASEYRKHAEECRVLAEAALTPQHKAILENMSKTWEMLAKSREDRLQREQRLMQLEQLTAPRDS
jgi:DNA transposition AAA+ family ATPase